MKGLSSLQYTVTYPGFSPLSWQPRSRSPGCKNGCLPASSFADPVLYTSTINAFSWSDGRAGHHLCYDVSVKTNEMFINSEKQTCIYLQLLVKKKISPRTVSFYICLVANKQNPVWAQVTGRVLLFVSHFVPHPGVGGALLTPAPRIQRSLIPTPVSLGCDAHQDTWIDWLVTLCIKVFQVCSSPSLTIFSLYPWLWNKCYKFMSRWLIELLKYLKSQNTISSAITLFLRICSNVIDTLGNNLIVMQISHLLMCTFILQKHQVNSENCTQMNWAAQECTNSDMNAA